MPKSGSTHQPAPAASQAGRADAGQQAAPEMDVPGHLLDRALKEATTRAAMDVGGGLESLSLEPLPEPPAKLEDSILADMIEEDEAPAPAGSAAVDLELAGLELGGSPDDDVLPITAQTVAESKLEKEDILRALEEGVGISPPQPSAMEFIEAAPEATME